MDPDLPLPPGAVSPEALVEAARAHADLPPDAGIELLLGLTSDPALFQAAAGLAAGEDRRVQFLLDVATRGLTAMQEEE